MSLEMFVQQAQNSIRPPSHADPSMGTTVTILALCAKTASNVGWFVNYLQNMEIFPTTARVTGMNITANCATAIGIAAPYVVLLVSMQSGNAFWTLTLDYIRII